MSRAKNLVDLDKRHVWHPFTQARTAPDPIPIRAARGAILFAEDFFSDSAFRFLINSLISFRSFSVSGGLWIKKSTLSGSAICPIIILYALFVCSLF